jgi:hypothetical protein
MFSFREAWVCHRTERYLKTAQALYRPNNGLVRGFMSTPRPRIKRNLQGLVSGAVGLFTCIAMRAPRSDIS